MANKSKMVVWSLVVVIAVLALLLVYILVVQPAVGNYVYGKQVTAYNQAQSDVVNTMLVQLQQQGYIQIPVGNQTLYLVAAQPKQGTSGTANSTGQ